MERFFKKFNVENKYLNLRKKHKKYLRKKEINEKSIQNVIRAIIYSNECELNLNSILKFFENEELYINCKIKELEQKMRIFRNIDLLYEKCSFKIIKKLHSNSYNKMKIDCQNIISESLEDDISYIKIYSAEKSYNAYNNSDYRNRNKIEMHHYLEIISYIKFNIEIKFHDGRLLLFST
jgi:hypothetical protein